MRKIILAIPIMTILMDIAIWLNIPIFRDIIVFIYLSFIPGFVLLRIMKLNERNIVDTVLFSVGLSIAFSMFVGLVINGLYLIGILRPLSVIPLTIILSFLTMIFFAVGFRQELSEDFDLRRSSGGEPIAFIPKSVIFVLLPVLGAVGAIFLNIPILLSLIILISIAYALSIFSHRLVPSNLYPLMIFSVALALLFHVVFTSNFIIGYDANLEYYVFKLTQINAHWGFINPTLYTAQTVNYNSMLSITILPTIYQSLMNINGETVFKLLYPFIFSLVPVVLYRLYEKQIGRLASLISVLFFISGLLVFYGVTSISLDRQIVGTLFFTLSILIVVNQEMSISSRRMLLIVFGAALVVSHYSLTYIFLVFISFIYIVSKIKGDSDKVLDGMTVLFFFVATFLWYSLSVSPISSLVQFLYGFISRFSIDIFNPAARSTQTFVSQPLSSITNSISIAIFFTAHILIAIGILCIIFRPQRVGLSPKYRTISILGAITLTLAVALPNLAPSLSLDRFYQISLLFIAPCFCLGFKICSDLSKSAWRKVIGRRPSENRSAQIGMSLLCILLVSFLLTQSGFVNRVMGDSPIVRSVNIDRVKTSNNLELEIDFYSAYLPEQDVFSAVWLQRHMVANSTVFADSLSQVHVLTSYGLIPLQQMRSLSNWTTLEHGSLVYLGRLNVVNNVIDTYEGLVNSSEIWSRINQTDTIYSNGDSEILYAISP